MRVFTNISGLQRTVEHAISSGNIVGLVPTMGALHQGHMALVRRALLECDYVVVSIFVNPTQFTEAQDFNSYPRTPDADLELLKSNGASAVFLPDYAEIYPKPDTTNYDFGLLEEVYEGKFRPGHFKGVAMVVKRFFELVKPHKSFFGLKDYQQVKVIQAMVAEFKVPVQIIGIETIREPDGLAMSSRNQLLTPEHRKLAPLIYQTLTAVKDRIKDESLESALEWGRNFFIEHADFELEYLDIANSNNLQAIKDNSIYENAVLLIAVRLGRVRLIDNIELNDNQ